MNQENQITVSMLLKESARNPGTIEKVQEIAKKLGFTSSSTGRATLSFQMTPTKFEGIFGITPVQSENRQVSDSDFGRPAGYHVSSNLSVPSELAEHVQMVSVEGSATRLDDSKSE